MGRHINLPVQTAKRIAVAPMAREADCSDQTGPEQRQRVESELKETGCGAPRESAVLALAQVMGADERILGSIQGVGHADNLPHMVAFSESRIYKVVTRRRMFGGDIDSQVSSGSWVGVSTIDHRIENSWGAGLVIHVLNPDGYVLADQLKPSSTDALRFREFVEKLNKRLSDLRTRDSAVRERVTSTLLEQEPRLLDELERLGNLRKQGLLSEEEFTLAKKKILGIDV